MTIDERGESQESETDGAQPGGGSGGGDHELEILRRSAVMAPPGSRVPVLRELLLRLIARGS